LPSLAPLLGLDAEASDEEKSEEPDEEKDQEPAEVPTEPADPGD
jgi:hypothetical protein